MSATPLDIRLATTVEFATGTSCDIRSDLMSDLEDVIDAIMNAGQNVNSGDGEFYNNVESFAVSFDVAARNFYLDVTFLPGTQKESIDALKDDIDDSLSAIFNEGQNSFSGDGKCYNSVEWYDITCS